MRTRAISALCRRPDSRLHYVPTRRFAPQLKTPVVARRRILLATRACNTDREGLAPRRAPNQEAGGDTRTRASSHQAAAGFGDPFRAALKSRQHVSPYMLGAYPSAAEVAIWTVPYTTSESRCTAFTSRDSRDDQNDSVGHNKRAGSNHRVSHLLQHPLMGIV